MKLKAKIYLVILVPLVMVTLSTAYIFAKSATLTELATKTKEESAHFALAAAAAKLDVVQVQQFLTDISATGGVDGLGDGFDEAQKSASSLRQSLSEFRSMYRQENDSEGLALINEIESEFDAYYQKGKELANAYIKEGREAGNKKMAEFDSYATALGKSVDKLQHNQNAELEASMDQVIESSNSMHRNTLIIAVITFVSCLLLGQVIASNIISRIYKMLPVLGEMAKGNFQQHVECSGSDELSSMGNAINHAIESIRNLIKTIAEQSGHVATAAEELTSISQELSRFSEENLKETSNVSESTTSVANHMRDSAVALEEMSATISEIAQNAASVATTAGEARVSSQDAAKIVSNVGEESKEITNVINLITSIAEQTNLLALNATIEAARAGEMGKGFAVVANEVKELAKASSNAAEGIVSRIQGLQAETKKATSATSEFDSMIGKINEITQSIAGAVEEQNVTARELAKLVSAAASSSDGITQNIGHVTEIAELNSNRAGEISSVSRNLADLASHLEHLVKEFRV